MLDFWNFNFIMTEIHDLDPIGATVILDIDYDYVWSDQRFI